MILETLSLTVTVNLLLKLLFNKATSQREKGERMNKLEIDTEKNKFLLNGKPIKNATEITIRITPNDIPEATITVMCETDMVLNNCELADS